jgi:hypothetical protein
VSAARHRAAATQQQQHQELAKGDTLQHCTSPRHPGQPAHMQHGCLLLRAREAS